MSNTPPSPVALTIQRSALLFVVLVLVLGALLLAATNIDPKASVRPGLNYTPWTSPDGLLSLEYPKSWRLTSTGLAHQLVSDDNNMAMLVRLWRTDQIKQAGVTANTTPEELMQLINTGPSAASVQIKPVTVGNLKGSSIHQSVTNTDPQTGASTANAVDIWVLALDPTHILVASAQYPDPLRAQSQPIFEHIMSTVQVRDIPAAMKAIEAAVPTATNTPTITPTITPTATFTSSPTPTKTNTPTATNTNTPTPTNTPTATFTNTSQPTPTLTNTATSVPTNTPAPTNTSVPTNTPAPTDTPPSSPTSTANPPSEPSLTPTAV